MREQEEDERIILANPYGKLRVVLLIFSIAMVGYQMISVQKMLLDESTHLVLHLLSSLVIGFVSFILLRLAKWQGRKSTWQVGIAVAGIAAALITHIYIILNADRLQYNQPYINNVDIAVGFLLITTLMVATWIFWGKVFVAVSAIVLLYMFFGQNIPGPMGHAGFTVAYLISDAGMGVSRGAFAFALPISAHGLFLLMIFGALFGTTGVLPAFFELGRMLGNRLRGGAAFCSLIGSMFVGTVTGSAVANVILTGRMTIPTMKREGFRAEDAGAIEAISSCGGQVLPPVMGLAVFFMAIFIGVPYIDLAIAGFFPAIIYYISVSIAIFYLVRQRGIYPARIPADIRIIVHRLPVFVFPLGVLIALLLFRYSLEFAAFYAILSQILVASLLKETRPSMKDWADGMQEGAVIGAQLAIIIALVGIIGQGFVTTGLGAKISVTIGSLAGYSLIPALLVVTAASVILGMGMPTEVAYVLVAFSLSPLLISQGLSLITAHFFIFYYATFSTLTPPVALAVLAGSKLAEASYMRTTFVAMRLGLVGFMLPWAFVFAPRFLSFPKFDGMAIVLTIVLVLSFFPLSAFLFRYHLRRLGWLEWALNGATVILAMLWIVDRSPWLLAIFFLLWIGVVARPVVVTIISKRTAWTP